MATRRAETSPILPLATNLRRARHLAGFSQRELAARADVDPQQISKWERGAITPSTENLAAIASALGRDLSWFFVEHEAAEAAA
jgi:transcriptional regulator with XRE-family HTH domain